MVPFYFPRIFRGVVLASLLLASPAWAQYQGGGDTVYEYANAATRSLTAGPTTLDVSFQDPSLGVAGVSLDGLDGFGVRLAGKSSALSAAYGSGEADAEALAAELSFGPRITPRGAISGHWNARATS